VFLGPRGTRVAEESGLPAEVGGSFEQGNKSGLFEMPVAGQRVGHVPLAHDGKGDKK
jgi:hypothetical protein